MTTDVRRAPLPARKAPWKRELVASLSRAHEATLRLVEPLDDEQLVAQVSPIMSPFVWDLAHIGWFEEHWLIRRVANNTPSLERFDDVYDAFRHPREERSKLPILTPPEARAYLSRACAQHALRVLEGVALDHADPLLRDGFDPQEAGGRRVILLSGDDADAKAEVVALFEDTGFAAIDLGDLATGGAMQQIHHPLAGFNLIRL
jgi:hypothetical protein